MERKNFDLKESLETMKKRYGTYGRKESWIVIRFGKYGRKISWIVKWYGQYERKVSWKVKWYEKYGRKKSWIVKRYGKYRRNQSWIVKWYGKYGRKASRIVKRFGKYRRKLWKDMKHMEYMEEKYFSFYKTINTACNLYKFTLCPTVRGNNYVYEGINL
jgi:hypothetical protein